MENHNFENIKQNIQKYIDTTTTREIELRQKNFIKALELVDILEVKESSPQSKFHFSSDKDKVTQYILLDIGESALNINDKQLQTKVIDTVLEKLAQFELDELNKTKLAYILAKYGKLKEAYSKLQELIFLKCEKNFKKYEENLLNAEIPILCQSGNYKKALQISKNAPYTLLAVKELIKNNQLEKALSLIPDLASEWSKEKAYQLFVNRLLTGDLFAFTKFINPLPDYAKTHFFINILEQIQSNSSLFNDQLMDAITKQIDQIWFNSYKSNVLAKLGEVLSVYNSKELADDMFLQAQKFAEKIELPWQKAIAISKIAYHIHKSTPDKSKTLFEKSFKILDELQKDYYKGTVFPQIAIYLFKSGYKEWAKNKFCEALNIISNIPKSYVRFNLTKGLSDCLMELDFDINTAFIIDEFCKIANSNKDKDESMEQFAKIITTLIHWGKIEKAVNIANNIDSRYYNKLENQILNKFFRIKNYPEQLEFFEKFVKDISNADRHLASKIAALYLKTGKFRNMIELLKNNKNVQKNLIDVIQEFKNVETIAIDREILHDLLQMAKKDKTYMMHILNYIINAIAKNTISGSIA